MQTQQMNIQSISVQNLHLDPGNPRLPTAYRNSNEATVINWMLMDASLLELIGSIAQNGFFTGEPLLVIPKDGEAGHYTVVEGNRRLASVKLLHSPEIADSRRETLHELIAEMQSAGIQIPESLPVIEYSSEAEVQQYLGFRHVTGIKSWGALAKARYLRKLYTLIGSNVSERDKYRQLAKAIGSRMDYVRNIVTSYRLFEIIEEENFYRIPQLSDENFEFSLLNDAALRYSGTKEFLRIDTKLDDPLQYLNHVNLRDLVFWLYERNTENRTRVGESRNISVLNAVVQVPEALEAFKNGKSLEEAVLLTSIPNDIIKNSIERALAYLKQAQSNIHLLSGENGLKSELKEINMVVEVLYRAALDKESPLKRLD
jgi:hypothetical protein